MKKALSLILALVLCLSLYACGEKESKPTKEQLLASAVDINTITFFDDCTSNLERAKEKHKGQIYKFSVVVQEINEDSITAGYLVFPLDRETLLTLSVDDCIEVVGRVSDIVVVETPYRTYKMVFDLAYYLGEHDNFSVTVRETVSGEGYILVGLKKVQGTNGLAKVYLDKETINSLADGDELQLEGKLRRTELRDWIIDGQKAQVAWTIVGASIIEE